MQIITANLPLLKNDNHNHLSHSQSDAKCNVEKAAKNVKGKTRKRRHTAIVIFILFST